MYKVYLAGPWFYGDQPEKLSKVESCLDSFKELDVYSPRREIQVKPDSTQAERRVTFLADVKHVNEADFIVALVDDSDKGTLFECGLAYSANVPILYYAEYAETRPFNLMLIESCEKLGYVTNIEMLKERIEELLKIGLESMNHHEFKGIVE
jgi:nucleoside 2-deoxyribosyltransferase